jgi:hypothetical protein
VLRDTLGLTYFVASGVPGNPKWALAPAEMAWRGKSLGEICRQIQDPGAARSTPNCSTP